MVTSGRHRRDAVEDVPWYDSRRVVRRPDWLGPAAVGTGTVLLVAGAVLVGGSFFPTRLAGHTCTGPRATATVAAAPDHAAVLRRIAAEWSLSQPRVGADCAEVTVVAAGSAAVASALGSSAPGRRPDAWAPESAVWPALAATRPDGAAALPPSGIGLAATPVVIAVPRDRAAALGWPSRPVSWRALLGGLRQDPTWGRYGHRTWGRFLVGMTDPAQSTAALHTLLAVTDADRDGAVQPAEVANELMLERSVAVYAPDTDQLLARAGTPAAPVSAFPATEQAVLAHNAAAVDSRGGQLVPLYPAEGVADANHPFLVLRGSWVTAERRQIPADFADFALGSVGREAYARAGFRDRDRSPAAMPAATADARTVARSLPDPIAAGGRPDGPGAGPVAGPAPPGHPAGGHRHVRLDGRAGARAAGVQARGLPAGRRPGGAAVQRAVPDRAVGVLLAAGRAGATTAGWCRRGRSAPRSAGRPSGTR